MRASSNVFPSCLESYWQIWDTVDLKLHPNLLHEANNLSPITKTACSREHNMAQHQRLEADGKIRGRELANRSRGSTLSRGGSCQSQCVLLWFHKHVHVGVVWVELCFTGQNYATTIIVGLTVIPGEHNLINISMVGDLLRHMPLHLLYSRKIW